MSILSIPKGARNCTVLIRRSLVEDAGATHRRMLTEAGRRLCDQTRPYWSAVYWELESRFGPPLVCASRLPRSLLTLWELLHPEHFDYTDLLAGVVSLRRIQKGRWYPEQTAQGLTHLDLVRQVVSSEELQKGQQFEAVRVAYRRFITQDQSEPRIGIGHEPAMSLAAQGFLPTETLGFPECTGAAFYLDEASQIISVQKLVPDVVLASQEFAEAVGQSQSGR